jgi:hypothetical protein
MARTKLRIYTEKKKRELTQEEKRQIRERISKDDGDVYKLAEDFCCVPIQIAGIKAAMNRK